jgi:SPP1 family predicted phage head-tail adaptor
MNIGFLDRRITFVAPSTATNSYGEVYGSGVDYATVWAALDNKGASSAVIMEQETTRNTVTWRVRSSSTTRAVTPKYTIRYGSDVYNILAIQEVGRNSELYFITERVISE